ncbi:MAG: hypothetical protein OHK0046_15800 [Anaerolineae bacterium]
MIKPASNLGRLLIILIIFLVFLSIPVIALYFSIVNQETDTFLVRNDLTNIEDVTLFLSAKLVSGSTSLEDGLVFIRFELINCRSIDIPNPNLEDRFPNLLYDTGLSCRVPLAANKFDQIGFLDVWLTQPELELFFVFSQGVFQGFDIEIRRTGL